MVAFDWQLAKYDFLLAVSGTLGLSGTVVDL